MSDFVEEIFVGGKYKGNLKEKIESLKKEIVKLKKNLRSTLKDQYDDGELLINPNEILVDKSNKLLSDIEFLQNRVNEQVHCKLLVSSRELQKLSQELKEHNFSLNITNKLLDIQKCFEFLDVFRENEQRIYYPAATTFSKLNKLLNDNASNIPQLDIYPSLKKEYQHQYEIFVSDISNLWHKLLQCDVEEVPLKLKPVTLSAEFEIEEVNDIVKALHVIRRLDENIQSLSKKLLNLFIMPIIRNDCQANIVDEKHFSLTILQKENVPSCLEVLSNLKLFLKFLHNRMNVQIEEKHFVFCLARNLFEDFSRTLVNDCIIKAIPNLKAELEDFNEIARRIESFQEFLAEINFIAEDEKFLSKYTTNIDELYIDKKCENLLARARDVMKRDLHDSVQYTPSETQEIPLEIVSEFEEFDETKRVLSKNLFQFPSCQISKSVQEIVNLLNDILDEACDSTDEHALRLFYITRNILEMYAGLVPLVHKSYLETIPHQVALFHNNCWYLAHQSLTLILKYRSRFSPSLQQRSLLYCDQSVLLREVGTEHFLNHMKYQRNIIFDIIRNSGLSTIGQSSELPQNVERSLRQCIRQLELLHKVWLAILPENVYCKSVGTIVSDMVDDLVCKIVVVEDIPASVAEELVTLFGMVTKRLPHIFPQSNSIEKYVKTWFKLKELIIVLGATLRDIEERWADGKGPLANEFSAQHIKQLIRALFQNTERRSNLLSKIKEN